MLQSQLFTKTRKETPTGETAKNAQLLIRAGYIHKEMAGVYSFLPLGLRVLNNINNIIREEMNALGGQEIQMTALQNPDLWKKTDRWDQDVWFKSSLAAGGEVGLGWTQEEDVTEIARKQISSYRDLPFAVYQIQTKFRNEERAKSGILRGREFLMKDLYSFHASTEDLDDFYEKAKVAYENVFARVGLGDKTFLTAASGGTFSKYSHEFQTLSDAGEDTIYLDPEKSLAINEEIYSDEVLSDLGMDKSRLEEKKAIEIGNIFKLNTKFSEPLELLFADQEGETKPVLMGCYGIGVARVMGTIVEVLSDDSGIVWPESVAPFTAHVVTVGENESVQKEAGFLYEDLTKQGVSVLFDDRPAGAGEKLADSDLLGIPYRLVVSEKSLSSGGIEVKKRTEKEPRIVSEREVFNLFI